MPARVHLCLPLALLLCVSGAGAPVVEESAQYLSPAALVPDAQGRLLFIAEFTARQIAVFDTAAERVLRTIPLPERPSGMALSSDSSRLYVTGGVSDGKVYVVDTRAGAVVATLAAGHTPNAPILSRDGKTLFVSNRFNNDVSVHDLATRKLAARIGVSREPVAAALSADGKHLFVANQLPNGPSNAKQVAAVISVIDTATRRSAGEIRLPDGSTGLRDISLSSDGQYLYVTHILSRYQLPASQIERGWIQTNALAIVDARARKLVNSVLLDDINLGAANPWGVRCTRDGKYLVVAHAGTQEISVIDRPALHAKLEAVTGGGKVSDVSASPGEVVNDLAFLKGIRTRVALQGNGARSLAVIGSSVYAAEYFSDSVSIVPLTARTHLESRLVKLGKDVPLTAERRGEMFFHDAQYSMEKWLSCSSCHPSEGRPDGLNWDLMLDGVGNPKNTKSLLLSHQTPPTTITGTRPNAEASVRAGFQYIEFAQRPEEDAVSVDAYLKSLRPVPSPHLEDGKLSAAAERGKKVYEKAGCHLCHSGPYYTDMRKHNVGTGRGREEGIAFDVPTLVEIWRTAPYLHDGRAPTLKDLFTAPDSGRVHRLTERIGRGEIDDLVAFVSSL